MMNRSQCECRGTKNPNESFTEQIALLSEFEIHLHLLLHLQRLVLLSISISIVSPLNNIIPDRIDIELSSKNHVWRWSVHGTRA